MSFGSYMTRDEVLNLIRKTALEEMYTMPLCVNDEEQGKESFVTALSAYINCGIRQLASALEDRLTEEAAGDE